jgi:predicted dehydrogenase
MNIDRRQFMRTGAAIASMPRASVLGANSRVRLGAIGVGSRCSYLLKLLLDIPDNEMVAVCDVYEPRRTEARMKFGHNAKEYVDYRQLLENPEVDAVVIGAPDHWHAPITMAAVQAGKDVYVEKPVTHSPAEAEALEQAVTTSKRVVQTGMQQRSWPHIIEAKSVVDSGILGQITLIEAHWYQNHLNRRRARPEIDESKLDWKLFLGSAPAQPFNVLRYTDWRYYWDFGGGILTDLFTHWVDVIQWYMESNIPSTAAAMGAKYAYPDRECPDTITATYLYPGNFQVVFHSSLVSNLEGGGITIRGTEGMLRVERDGYSFYPEPTKYTESMELPPASRQVRLTQTDGTHYHIQNFLDCVRSRKTPNAPIAVGIDAARSSQMGNIAFRENRIISADSLPLRTAREREYCL